MAHASLWASSTISSPSPLTHGNGNVVLQAVSSLSATTSLSITTSIMVLVTVQLHAGQCLAHLAVHTGHRGSLSSGICSKVPCSVPYGCAPTEQGCKYVFLYNRSDKIEDLLFGIFHHFLAGKIRISLAGNGHTAGEDNRIFRCRTHGGTRIFIGGLLL